MGHERASFHRRLWKQDSAPAAMPEEINALREAQAKVP
jgi:hypothetical protein